MKQLRLMNLCILLKNCTGSILIKSNGTHVGFWNLLINSGISLITKDENQDGVQ